MLRFLLSINDKKQAKLQKFMQSASNILVLHHLKLSSVQLFQHKHSLSQRLAQARSNNLAIGLVPTMGALHEGHLSLISKAKNHCEVVVVSVFVNPTQFDNTSDLEKYPRTLDEDLAILEKYFPEVLVFSPSVKEIYGRKISSEKFDFGKIAREMEGKYRNGHFDGVGTVLKRLFEIVQPEKAFFGEKDYQQLLIVKKLVKLTKQPVEIIGCAINREENGLARSSRNERLSTTLRHQAAFIYKILNHLKADFGTKSALELRAWAKEGFQQHPNLELEYIEISDAETLKPTEIFEEDKKYRAFIAAYAGDVRLIDNIALN